MAKQILYAEDARAKILDGLTKLANRKYFMEQLEEALAARKAGQRILVAYCDLDNFKTINDTFGHPVGDALLCEVARGLREALMARFPVCEVSIAFG